MEITIKCKLKSFLNMSNDMDRYYQGYYQGYGPIWTDITRDITRDPNQIGKMIQNGIIYKIRKMYIFTLPLSTVTETSLPSYLLITGRIIVRFLPFPRIL